MNTGRIQFLKVTKIFVEIHVFNVGNLQDIDGSIIFLLSSWDIPHSVAICKVRGTFEIILFIYSFLTVLCLHCCVFFPPAVVSGGFFVVVVVGLLITMASLIAEYRL